MVTLTGATSMGSIVQCAALTAKLNGKPIATVGDVATYPQASDVLVEGVPGILLNGKPIVCSGGKTAMGACVMPNTCVKVSTPETYVGFAVVPLVDTKVTWESAQNKKEDSTTDNKEAMQEQTGGEQQTETIESSQSEEPEESENVTFESDFAPNELTNLAKTKGKILFMISMNRIFGYDGTAKAIEKLYDKAYKKPIKNPKFVVCKNKIQGKLNAAYSSETHKIYINEQFLREAVNDNFKRHELMIAIVEEYGHHLDYLIRYVYDNNENKDAEGDEGARFAYHGLYEIFNIDVIDAKETPFGTATIDGTQIELKWEYADVYEALKRCTAHRLEGTDDHYGEFEGFDVSGRKYEKDKETKQYYEGTGANHEKIQQDAFNSVNGKSKGINKDVYDNYTKNSKYFYRGNWLRDMSQLYAPILFRLLAEICLATQNSGNRYIKIDADPKHVYSIITDIVRIMALLHFKDDYRIRQIMRDKVVQAGVGQISGAAKDTRDGAKNVKQGSSNIVSIPKEMASSFFTNVFNGMPIGKAFDSAVKQGGKTFDTSVDSIQHGFELLKGVWGKFLDGISILKEESSNAIDEFLDAMSQKFNWREDFVDGEETGLIPGLGQAVGVSVTHDHCDNPKGLTKYATSPVKIYKGSEASVKGKIDQYYGNKGFLSMDVADNATEVKVNKTYGMKNHLKSTMAGSSFAVRKTVVESVAQKLSAIKPYSLTRKDAVVMGGALHTLQDFYAHSNYCEVYLSKYFKSVITWTDADHVNVNRSLLSSNNSKTVFKNIQSVNDVLKVNGVSMNASDNKFDYIGTNSVQGKGGDNRIYKKPFYAPITSGTCDMEDLLVCGMHLLDAKIDNIFYELEEKIVDRRNDKDEEMKPHQLAFNDIAIFALLELGKEISEGNEGKFELAAKAYYGFILLRETKVQIAKEMKEQVTDKIKENLKKLLPELILAMHEKIKYVKNLIEDVKTYLKAIATKLALFILLNILEQFELKKITDSTLGILDLMKMPKDSSEVSFAIINDKLRRKQNELEQDLKNKKMQETRAKANEAKEKTNEAKEKTKEAKEKTNEAKGACEGFYHSPLGRLYNGEDPSHTTLAKDSDVHPINDIAGKLATATSVEVLLDHMKNRYPDVETAKRKLGRYIAHPLLSNIYDKMIRDWACAHPQNVIKASLMVCVLERMSMKYRHVMVYKKRIQVNTEISDKIYGKTNEILNLAMRGIEQVDLNKIGKDLKKLDRFPDIFEAYFNSMYFELDARTFIQFTEDYERLEAKESNKVNVTRSDGLKKALMEKWKAALKVNVADFLKSLKNTSNNVEVQLRIPLLADLNVAPKKSDWLFYGSNLSQPERKVISAYSINLLNQVATRNRVRIYMTCSIKKISPLALGANSPLRYHCISEAKYAQVNVIDLLVKGDLNQKKAVIQDLLNSGVSRIIQKDFPNMRIFSCKPTQKLMYMKDEPGIHVEIKQ